MMRFVAAFIAALVAGWLLTGSATTAEAGYRHSGCCGGPLPPVYRYKTVRQHKHQTRYRDRSVYRHVQRIRRIVHVTRVQPVVHTHVVTRVHHHTIFHTKNAYERATVYLPPVNTVYGSTKHYYDCSCR
jgi:hypothetical protein